MNNPQYAVFSHPAVKNRLRFDLLSNGLSELEFLVEEQAYPLGDLSVGGFCVLVPPVGAGSDDLASPFLLENPEGEHVRGTFRFAKEALPAAVKLVGVVKNTQSIGLNSIPELIAQAERWFSAHPEFSETHHSAQKLASMVEATGKLTKENQFLLGPMNVSVMNLLIEAQMPFGTLNNIFNPLHHQPQVRKLGVEFFTAVEGMELLEFTKPLALYPPT